jgi:hypothetical protein
MRKPTEADAELLLKLYEIRRDPELRRARAWLLSEFKPTTWADVKSRYLSHVEEDRWYRMTTSYWEMVAAIVNRGLLDAELFFDHTGEDIVTWERIKGLIPDARADIRPTYLIQFERMVSAHQAYRKRTNEAALRAEAKPARNGAGRPGAKAAGAGKRRAAR